MKTPKRIWRRLAVAAMLACSFQILAAVVHAQGKGHGPPVDARTQLLTVDDDATGDIRLKEHKGRSAIHVFVRHLNQGEVYDVTISRDDPAAEELLGTITIPGGDEDDGDGNGDGDDDGNGAPRCFEATLTGNEEVPTATGRAKFVLSGRNRDVLHYQMKFENVPGPPVAAAHIHMGEDEDGAIVVELDPEKLKGRIELNESLDLASGNFYVNVHTEANPAGEIRGKISICDDENDDDGDDDRSGNGKLKIDTQRGDTLPLGADSIKQLLSTTVRVSNADGVVVLTGKIMDLDKHNPGEGQGSERGGSAGDDNPGQGQDRRGAGGAVTEALILEDFLFDLYGRYDASFQRGDSNMDGIFNVSDPVHALRFLFQTGSLPLCRDAADANDDGTLDISDPVSMLLALFSRTEPLPPPVVRGFDRTADELFCVDLE